MNVCDAGHCGVFGMKMSSLSHQYRQKGHYDDLFFSFQTLLYLRSSTRKNNYQEAVAKEYTDA